MPGKKLRGRLPPLILKDFSHRTRYRLEWELNEAKMLSELGFSADEIEKRVRAGSRRRFRR
jgi:hypothetical protein